MAGSLGTRRQVLRGILGTFGTMAIVTPSLARPRPRGVRKVALYNVNTDERERIAYWEEGHYIPDALKRIDMLLRDHHNGEVRHIDPRLIDLLSTLARKLETHSSFEVVSGYRSPASNAALAKKKRRVAHDSLHIQGMAVDVILPDRDLVKVRDAALSLRMGGVGYYPKAGFVHLDVGPVRSWG
jgi:uncharacterized protein YcbK (DUF882 family)